MRKQRNAILSMILCSLFVYSASPTIWMKDNKHFIAEGAFIVGGLTVFGLSLAASISARKKINVLKKANLMTRKGLRGAQVDFSMLSSKEQVLLQNMILQNTSPRNIRMLKRISDAGMAVGFIVTACATVFGIKDLIGWYKDKKKNMHNLVPGDSLKKEGVSVTNKASDLSYAFENKDFYGMVIVEKTGDMNGVQKVLRSSKYEEILANIKEVYIIAEFKGGKGTSIYYVRKPEKQDDENELLAMIAKNKIALVSQEDGGKKRYLCWGSGRTTNFIEETYNSGVCNGISFNNAKQFNQFQREIAESLHSKDLLIKAMKKEFAVGTI